MASGGRQGQQSLLIERVESEALMPDCEILVLTVNHARIKLKFAHAQRNTIIATFISKCPRPYLGCSGLNSICIMHVILAANLYHACDSCAQSL